MVNEICQAAKELEIEGEEVMLLQHIVLSHHGKEEWGSPKETDDSRSGNFPLYR